ncbi:MAG: hypothetical protein AAF513_05005 [Pseudomonadota bacterium]
MQERRFAAPHHNRLRHLVGCIALLLAATTLSAQPALTADDTLDRFAATAPHLNPRPNQAELEQTLRNVCETESARACLRYIEENKLRVRSALPNNPAYWQAYRAALDAPPYNPIECYLDTAVSPEKCFHHPAQHQLMETTYSWLWYQLAREEEDLIAQFTAIYQRIRTRSAQSPSMLNKMIDIAMLSIVQHQLGLLLGRSAERGELENVRALRRLATPHAKEVRSLGPAFAGEIALRTNARKRFEAPERYGQLEMGDELDNGVLDALLHDESYEDYLKALVAVSEQSWSDYWQYGFTTMPLAIPSGEDAYAPILGALSTHVQTGRSSEVPVFLLPALADIYQGLSDPGIPDRPPPPFWEWRWLDAEQTLCLIPQERAVGPSDFTRERGACMAYFPLP